MVVEVVQEHATTTNDNHRDSHHDSHHDNDSDTAPAPMSENPHATTALNAAPNIHPILHHMITLLGPLSP